MRRTTVFIFMSFMLLYSISNAKVQVKKEDIPFGKTIAIFSKILDEERPIYIYLPFGYESNLKRYPVLYLTDGRLIAFRNYAGVIQYYSRTYFPGIYRKEYHRREVSLFTLFRRGLHHLHGKCP